MFRRPAVIRNAACAVLLCVLVSACQHTKPGLHVVSGAALDEDAFEAFRTNLQTLADSQSMAGLSAGIVHGGKLVWARGFGFADVEQQIAATPDTPYPLGTCSQALASVLLMRLVDEGMVSLDEPMTSYPIHAWFPNSRQPERYASQKLTVRNVLENTTGPAGGTSFHYNSNLFADLTWVIEQGSGLSYPRALSEYLLEPAGMSHTVPGQLSPGYEEALKQLARPYNVQSGNPLRAAYRVLGLSRLFEGKRGGAIEPVELDPGLEEERREVLGAAYTPLYGVNASVGAISTVKDLAAFDAALDGDGILSPASRDALFGGMSTADRTSMPEGLGWFVQPYEGTTLVWQFGCTPPSVSALYIKAPQRNLTFIALANTDRLCAGYGLETGDVRTSPFARLFLETFIAPPASPPAHTTARRTPRNHRPG